MKYVIRKVPERDTSYLEKLLPNALIYNDVNHEGCIKSFVGAIKTVNDDALFVQDDMILAKGFVRRAEEYVQKHSNSVIAFSNLTTDEKDAPRTEGFYSPRRAGWLLCTYIPKRIQDTFLKFYETELSKYKRSVRFDMDDQLFSRCLDHYMDEDVFLTVPNLAGHPKNQSICCPSRHPRICANFDYNEVEV